MSGLSEGGGEVEGGAEGEGTLTLLGSGQVVRTHGEGQCWGRYCPIHHSSDHHMRTWPLNLRVDDLAHPLMERICGCGWAHPDPDSVWYLETRWPGGYWDLHGCCPRSCCRPPTVAPAESE